MLFWVEKDLTSCFFFGLSILHCITCNCKGRGLQYVMSSLYNLLVLYLQLSWSAVENKQLNVLLEYLTISKCTVLAQNFGSRQIWHICEFMTNPTGFIISIDLLYKAAIICVLLSKCFWPGIRPSFVLYGNHYNENVGHYTTVSLGWQTSLDTILWWSQSILLLWTVGKYLMSSLTTWPHWLLCTNDIVTSQWQCEVYMYRPGY